MTPKDINDRSSHGIRTIPGANTLASGGLMASGQKAVDYAKAEWTLRCDSSKLHIVDRGRGDHTKHTIIQSHAR